MFLQLLQIFCLCSRKLGDGLFLKSCEDVSKFYPNIEFETMIIDNCCMQVMTFPKFPASSHLLCLYSSVCVRPVQKPHCWFSHDVVYIETLKIGKIEKREIEILYRVDAKVWIASREC